jgi:RNA polymerase sigma factor (sigma-70 family)
MPGYPSQTATSAESLSHADQASLVARIIAADPAAESELVARYEGPLFTMLLYRVRQRDAARDLLQDVFVAALPALRRQQLRDPGLLAAFLHGIAKNLANEFIRRAARRPVHVEVDPELLWADCRDEMDATARLHEVTSALGELTDTDQTLLRLALVDGCKPRELAHRLGLSAEVVRTRKMRALKRLLTRLTPSVMKTTL